MAAVDGFRGWLPQRYRHFVWAPEDEDQTVRQYRFLLRTAPLDALEAGHVEALEPMWRSRRSVVLRAVQEGLVAGARLDADDVRRLAHLIVLGERRRPGDFLASCPRAVLTPLAGAVILSEAMFGRFGGYAAWDGAEPDLADATEWADGGFGEHWHDVLTSHVSYRTATGAPSSPDAAFGGV